jgi:hypothetical protein
MLNAEHRSKRGTNERRHIGHLLALLCILADIYDGRCSRKGCYDIVALLLASFALLIRSDPISCVGMPKNDSETHEYNDASENQEQRKQDLFLPEGVNVRRHKFSDKASRVIFSATNHGGCNQRSDFINNKSTKTVSLTVGKSIFKFSFKKLSASSSTLTFEPSAMSSRTVPSNIGVEVVQRCIEHCSDAIDPAEPTVVDGGLSGLNTCIDGASIR